jgi:regulator of sigma E protease
VSFVVALAAGLFMIGFLVVVHEAGHFFFAKLFGVGVPVFSIGMGPRLFGFVFKGTDYRISALPVGGYVQMSGADPFGEEDAGAWVPPEEDFMRKPVWQRLIIMAAGPAVNLILPFVLFVLLLMMGRPEIDSTLGIVHPATPAELAGLVVGDQVRAVDGEEVVVWHDLEQILQARLDGGAQGPIAFGIQRGARDLQITVPGSALLATAHDKPDFVRLGMEPRVYPALVGSESALSPSGMSAIQPGDLITHVDGDEILDWPSLVAALSSDAHDLSYKRIVDDEVVEGEVRLEANPDYASPDLIHSNRWGLVPAMLLVETVVEESPAAALGVVEGDRLVDVDGVNVTTFGQFMDLVARSSDGVAVRSVALGLMRDGERLDVELTPELKLVPGDTTKRPIIGISALYREPLGVAYASKYYSLIEAIPRAWVYTVEVMRDTARVMRNVFAMESDWRENVGGPIAIFYVAGVVAERGFFQYAETVGVISVSLGLINLLPVPVLDGGQILFYLIEGIRGRPLSLEFRERVQMIGVLALVVVMLVVVFNDLSRVSMYVSGPG